MFMFLLIHIRSLILGCLKINFYNNVDLSILCNLYVYLEHVKPMCCEHVHKDKLHELSHLLRMYNDLHLV